MFKMNVQTGCTGYIHSSNTDKCAKCNMEAPPQSVSPVQEYNKDLKG